MEIYSKWFEKRFSIGPKIDGQQGKALKDLISYLTTQVKKKPDLPEPEVEEKVKANWQWILDSWDKLEEFYQKKTKLSEISSNIQNIIIQAKTKSNADGNKNQGGQKIGRIDTGEVSEYLDRRNDKGNAFEDNSDQARA